MMRIRRNRGQPLNSPGNRWLSPILILLLVVSRAAAVRADQAAVRLQATADRTEVHVGEPIRYVVTLTHPADVSVQWPAPAKTVGPFSIERSGAEPSVTEHSVTTQMRWYQLSIYETGPQTIPEPTATARGADGADHPVRGNAITITVKTLLPHDWQQLDIRHPKPFIVPFRPLWWGMGLLVLIVASGVGWWWSRRAPHRHAVTPPPRPAHELAQEALDALQREDLPSRGLYEPYYVRLSTIIRTYIESRFNVRAPEMTTEEFLQAAAQADALRGEHRRLLQEFLMRCDLVKFARYQPSVGEAKDAWQAAQRFVRETIPALPLAVEKPVSG